MEDEDGTCLLDVLCDPQALNDFLHGTSELQPEDLLINSSSGEPSLFPDAPSPVSLSGDSPDSPPPGCVDLSFLEDALLSSPDEPEAERVGPAVEDEEEEEEEERCDILQQSLQEAQITEQTMEDSLSLYSPAPLLSPAGPFVPKSVTLPVPSALPRDTQAAVEPPQPSLLAVGPGCPSLKPQLMGLLPGQVFPAPPPDASFSLSPAQGSSMILHKAVPSVIAAAAAAPGMVLQRAPLPIQPKPRLVQISPKPGGQKPAAVTFVAGNASPNVLLPPGAGQKPAAAAPTQQLPKPLSLQLVNQGGSFLLQPQGLFQGQNQFLLPGQCPVTISQPARAAQPLLPSGHRGASFHGVSASGGQLLDGPQILTVPQRQLNFSPVFTPSGQLALRQAAVLSGPLQLQSAPAAVFQMPAQLAGAYAPGGRGQRATLVHSPALTNHITLINSSGVLPPDLTSISVVQGLPFAARAPQTGGAEAPLSLQASVVLLPDRTVQEEPSGSEESFGQPVQRPPAGLQASPSPVVPVLQPPPEPAAVEIPKPLLPPVDLNQVVEEVTQSMDPNQAMMQHLQQEPLSPPNPSDLLVGALPVAPMEPLSSPAPSPGDPQPQTLEVSGQDATRSDPGDVSPPRSDSEDLAAVRSPAEPQDAGEPVSTFSPPQMSLLRPETPTPPSCIQPQVQYQDSHELQTQTLFTHNQSRAPQPAPLVQFQVSPTQQPLPTGAGVSTGGDESRVQQHNKPPAALVVDSKAFAVHVQPSSPAAVPDQTQTSQTSTTPAGRPDVQRDEKPPPAMRRHRFQQQLCTDRAAVQNPSSGPAFPTLKDAVRRLLPYHTCAGRLPTQDDFTSVDREFDAVSGFLLKRTKDMVNKYRQLLVRETQQESPSAEMVMLERLFLQAERCTLAEDRRRARRDPETFQTVLSSPHGAHPSGPSHSPSSPPPWARLSERPPGLKTYRSSSRGALRLTIKQESGSRKVVHNSACDPGLKRDHTGQLTNGDGAPRVPRHNEVSNGGQTCNAAEQSKQTAPDFKIKAPSPPCKAALRDVSAPKLKCYRLDASTPPPPPPLQEDNVLSEHLQSAIDSILELQRLQGPPAAPTRPTPGPSLDQAVTSILEGHL